MEYISISIAFRDSSVLVVSSLLSFCFLCVAIYPLHPTSPAESLFELYHALLNVTLAAPSRTLPGPT
jgi:hypothetical protein